MPDADIPPNLGLLKLNYKMTFLREAFLCLIHSEKEGNAAVFWLKNKLNLVCQFFTSNSVLENGKKEKNLLHYFSSWNASPVLVPVVKVNEKKEIVLNVLDEQDTQVTQKWYLTQDILKLFGFQKRIEESFKVWYFSPFNVGMELPQYFNLCLKYLEKVETQNKQEEEESNIQRKKKAEEILNNRAFLPTTLVTPSLKKKKEEKVSLSFSKSPKTQNDKNPPKRKNSKSNENQDINIKTEHSSKISYSKRRSRNEISCNNNSSPLLKLVK